MADEENKIDEGIDEKIYNDIRYVYEVLNERGYNPVNQIVGYLLSGDLGYISSYKNARKVIGKLDRNKIIEIMFKEYMKCDI